MTSRAAAAPLEVASRLAAVRARIDTGAARAGRDPSSIRLVGVVKGVKPAAVEAAYSAGLEDFGESFVQEAASRRAHLALDVREASWHLIGHLQTNKVAAALGLFDIIQAVDSQRLAEQLSRRAINLRVLLEVNVSGEASKFGFAPAEVGPAAAAIARLPNLEVMGLMTVAPAGATPGEARRVFATLRELAAANGLTELSMGMSDDFESAIAEGATIVRIGRAIFGERE